MISIFVTLILVGVALYLVNRIIPMENWVKTVLNAVVAVCVLLWLLQVFGLYHFPLRVRG